MFAVELTKKDCFPSGHVAVAIVCWILARRIHRPLGFVFGVVAAGVILSTVYLRYHYVVDVIAGALLAAFALTGWLRAPRPAERTGSCRGPSPTHDHQ